MVYQSIRINEFDPNDIKAYLERMEDYVVPSMNGVAQISRNGERLTGSVHSREYVSPAGIPLDELAKDLYWLWDNIMNSPNEEGREAALKGQARPVRLYDDRMSGNFGSRLDGLYQLLHASYGTLEVKVEPRYTNCFQRICFWMRDFFRWLKGADVAQEFVYHQMRPGNHLVDYAYPFTFELMTRKLNALTNGIQGQPDNPLIGGSSSDKIEESVWSRHAFMEALTNCEKRYPSNHLMDEQVRLLLVKANMFRTGLRLSVAHNADDSDDS